MNAFRENNKICSLSMHVKFVVNILSFFRFLVDRKSVKENIRLRRRFNFICVWTCILKLRMETVTDCQIEINLSKYAQIEKNGMLPPSYLSSSSIEYSVITLLKKVFVQSSQLCWPTSSQSLSPANLLSSGLPRSIVLAHLIC